MMLYAIISMPIRLFHALPLEYFAPCDAYLQALIADERERYAASGDVYFMPAHSRLTA